MGPKCPCIHHHFYTPFIHFYTHQARFTSPPPKLYIFFPFPFLSLYPSPLRAVVLTSALHVFPWPHLLGVFLRIASWDLVADSFCPFVPLWDTVLNSLTSSDGASKTFSGSFMFLSSSFCVLLLTVALYVMASLDMATAPFFPPPFSLLWGLFSSVAFWGSKNLDLWWPFFPHLKHCGFLSSTFTISTVSYPTWILSVRLSRSLEVSRANISSLLLPVLRRISGNLYNINVIFPRR